MLKLIIYKKNWREYFIDVHLLFFTNGTEDEEILQSLKKQQPNLDISQIEIVNKIKFEFISNNLFVKFKVKKNSLKYPKKEFFLAFFVQLKLWTDRTIYKIGNKKLIRDWEINFYNWNNSYNTFKKDINNINDKYLKKILSEFKLNEFKTQLFNLNVILEIIYDKFEKEEVTDELILIKNKLKSLNNKITSLTNEINKINNDSVVVESLKMCGGVYSILSGIFGITIPDSDGIFISSLATIIGGFCEL